MPPSWACSAELMDVWCASPRALTPTHTYGQEQALLRDLVFCSLSRQAPAGRMDTINIHSALTGLLKAMSSFFFSLQGRFIYSDYAKGLLNHSL